MHERIATYGNFRGAVGQDILHSVVLGKKHVVIVEERDLKCIGVLGVRDPTQMVLSWHLESRVPIGLPPTANRESSIEVNFNTVVLPDSISCGNVPNEVIKVHVLDVPGVLGVDLTHAIHSVLFLVEVDSTELTLELGSDVLERVVVIDCKETPVRNAHGLGGLGQDKLWSDGPDQKTHKIEAVGRPLLVRAILKTMLCPLGIISLSVVDKVHHREIVKSLLVLHEVGAQDEAGVAKTQRLLI